MFMMRLFRKKPGDIGKGDVPATETDLDQAEAELREHLAARFASATSPRVKPTIGQLVDDNDVVVATYHMRPSGAVKVPK